MKMLSVFCEKGLNFFCQQNLVKGITVPPAFKITVTVITVFVIAKKPHQILI